MAGGAGWVGGGEGGVGVRVARRRHGCCIHNMNMYLSIFPDDDHAGSRLHPNSVLLERAAYSQVGGGSGGQSSDQ